MVLAIKSNLRVLICLLSLLRSASAVPNPSPSTQVPKPRAAQVPEPRAAQVPEPRAARHEVRSIVQSPPIDGAGSSSRQQDLVYNADYWTYPAPNDRPTDLSSHHCDGPLVVDIAAAADDCLAAAGLMGAVLAGSPLWEKREYRPRSSLPADTTFPRQQMLPQNYNYNTCRITLDFRAGADNLTESAQPTELHWRAQELATRCLRSEHQPRGAQAFSTYEVPRSADPETPSQLEIRFEIFKQNVESVDAAWRGILLAAMAGYSPGPGNDSGEGLDLMQLNRARDDLYGLTRYEGASPSEEQKAASLANLFTGAGAPYHEAGPSATT